MQLFFNKPLLSDTQLNEDNVIEQIRERLADIFLVLISIAATFAVFASLLRALDTGWLMIYTLHTAILLFLWLSVLLHHKIPSFYKRLILVTLPSLAAVAGLLKFGLLSQGALLFSLGALMSVVLFSLRNAVIITVAALAIYLVIALLFILNIHTVSIDIQNYMGSTTSWINQFVSLIFLMLFMLISIGWIFYSLFQMLQTLKDKNIELELSKKESEEAASIKADFLANMSHEIRTPMNAILGFVEQLAKTEPDPQRQKQFQVIKNSGHSLLTIINDILDLSKIESGKLSLDPQICNFKEALVNTVNLFEDSAKQKKITIRSDIVPAFPHYLMLDLTRVNQIIFNLLSNAIKFTPDKGHITVAADFDPECSMLHLSVTDSGIGIAPKNRQKIFQAFEQEDNSTTRRYGGTGLGLSISAKLVHLMKGSINVESEEGKGSHFYFSIPATLSETGPVQESTIQELGPIVLLQAKVLIVEDNKTNQMLLGIILDQLGIAFDIAADGLEALSMYQEKKYDLIFMDENMPNMNGIEATTAIRGFESQTGHHTPIIAVTANALAEDRERFINAGMDDYISKPYQEEDIKKALRSYLL